MLQYSGLEHVEVAILEQDPGAQLAGRWPGIEINTCTIRPADSVNGSTRLVLQGDK